MIRVSSTTLIHSEFTPSKRRIPAEDSQDTLENYQNQGIESRYDFSRIEFTYNSLYRKPYIGEMLEFSTFHWVIYMINNKCAESQGDEGPEPITYSFVLNLLKKFA